MNTQPPVNPDDPPDPTWREVSHGATQKEINQYLLGEIFKIAGLSEDSRWRKWLTPVFLPFIRRMSQVGVDFDINVARKGLRWAAQEFLKAKTRGVTTSDANQLPSEGALLIVANHPGTFDGLAIAASLPRDDLKIVVSGNPFFRTLPNMRNHLILATRNWQVRVATIRNALRHLQEGGALLIFPGGTIEPDPAYLLEAACQAVNRWSNSVELFLRKLPETRLVIAINSGFVAPEFYHHPLTRLRRRPEDRQKLAEIIQVIATILSKKRKASNQPNVTFASPVYLTQLNKDTKEGMASIAQLVRGAIQRRQQSSNPV